MFASKRTKINQSRTTIVINGPFQVDQLGPSVVSLVIKTNRNLTVLKGLQTLTYLKLDNTHINNIIDLPMLSVLNIDHNRKIKQIERLNNLFELRCNDCSLLNNIDLSNANQVIIENCYNLEKIKLPKVETLHLINCVNLKSIKLGPYIKTLQLDNCPAIETLDFLNINRIAMELLEVNNCEGLTKIKNITDCSKISITNCEKITKIRDLTNINILELDNCKKLSRIEYFYNVSICSISRCESIYSIEDIELNDFEIQYCPKICQITKLEAQNIKISYCHYLDTLSIEDCTRNLFIEECHILSNIKFKYDSTDRSRKLNITLKGRLAIEEISQWYISELTIIDNPFLHQLNAIYNLNKLVIRSCSNLRVVANMIILKLLEITDCMYLTDIENIMFIDMIRIINTPNLIQVGINCCSPSLIHIEDCNLLKLTIFGEHLKHLTLINTDIIIVTDLNPCALVKTLNSGYFPDLETNFTIWKEGKIIAEAISLINFDCRQKLMTKRIVNSIRAHMVKKYYHKLKELFVNPYCTICMEDIEDEMFVSKCFHTFHENCIRSWALEKNRCPLCNQSGILKNCELLEWY